MWHCVDPGLTDVSEKSIASIFRVAADTGSSLAVFCRLEMKATRPSETSVNPGSTQSHILEDDILHRLRVFENRVLRRLFGQ
jgi:hypothetical protein